MKALIAAAFAAMCSSCPTTVPPLADGGVVEDAGPPQAHTYHCKQTLHYSDGSPDCVETRDACRLSEADARASFTSCVNVDDTQCPNQQAGDPCDIDCSNSEGDICTI